MQQVEEQLLLVAVIARVAGGELAATSRSTGPCAAARRAWRDVGAGPVVGVDAALAGGVLRRQAERVPAHRVQHRIAAGALVAGDDVAERVVADVAHVDLPARVREHLQHVVFRLAVGRHVVHAEAAARPTPPASAARRCGNRSLMWSRRGRSVPGCGTSGTAVRCRRSAPAARGPGPAPCSRSRRW